MAVGTAGFTAAMAVVALEGRGLQPSDGPVLVTGASGGVGSTALALLADRGFEVWALTGKAGEHDRLRGLGAVGFLAHEDAPAEGKPLESERWAGAVDAAGAATLPYVLRTLRRGAAVAACGNASGSGLTTTVFPFILRGVALLGMDSVAVPLAERRTLWNRIATDLRPRSIDDAVTEVTLDDLIPALDAIVAGEARGRWVVRVAG
jgi:putative YhdH/YhfP family quinone oxidoreductase